MRISVIKIGNSKGIRIPQAILKQCQIDSEVDLEVEGRIIRLYPVDRRTYDMTFENIVQMNDQDIQEMLKRIDLTTLAFSLIGADESIKSRVFANMSTRAAQLTQQEVERLNALETKELMVEMHRNKINSALNEIS